MDKHKELKDQFISQVQNTIDSLNSSRRFQLQYKLDKDKSNRTIVTVFHPRNEKYNIDVSVGEEIIVFFDDFHFHHENYTDREKTIEQIVEESISQLKGLLTADQIIVTKFLKRKNVYKISLEIEHDGHREIVEDIFVGFKGFLWFTPTQKKVRTTSFIS